jgi:outer membrane protein
MKNSAGKAIILLAFLSAGVSANAQKFGHINIGNLLVQLPETKTADAQLKVYQDSLVAIGEAQAKKLQEDVSAFATEYRQGTITPAVAQQKQAEFQKRESDLQAMEEAIVNQMSAKREELIAPLLEKVQNAIDQIGKEGGYTMIFDTSVFNAILFAQNTDDIEPMLKSKLGIQ